jgi:hypothetical protein
MSGFVRLRLHGQIVGLDSERAAPARCLDRVFRRDFLLPMTQPGVPVIILPRPGRALTAAVIFLSATFPKDRFANLLEIDKSQPW